MKRLYLYLASKSKNGMKLITVLQGEEETNSTVDDLKDLHLPMVWERQISRLIHEHRMLYEARIESAKDFQELRSRLIHRGFKNIPMGACPLLHMQAYAKAPVADTSSCKVRKTMIRKKR